MQIGFKKSAWALVLVAGLVLSNPVRSDTTVDLDDPGSLPDGLYPALMAAVQGEAPAGYVAKALAEDAAYRAGNAAQDLAIDFGVEGIAVERRGERLAMTFVGYGRGAALAPGRLARFSVEDNRVEYLRGATGGAVLTEWYLNGPLGLEQGFTLSARPAGAGDLAVVLDLSGGLAPELGAKGRELRFLDAKGATVLRYGGLYAYDAAGKELPAHLVLNEKQLAIQVDDSGAAYPVTIDPLISTETKLQPDDFAASDQFGFSIAIDRDTVVAGAPFDDFLVGGVNQSNAGSAYVFVRSRDIWSQQAKLTASDAAAGDDFALSVAIDGDTVVVGSPFDDFVVVGGLNQPNAGSAYLFQRQAGSWTEQIKLVASDAADFDNLGRGSEGRGVAIEGNTVVAAAVLDDDVFTDQGAAYVFELLDQAPDEVLVEFGPGHGLWARMNDSMWRQLTADPTELAAVGDLDNSGQDDVVVDLGSSTGLAILYNNTPASLALIHGQSPVALAAGDMDGNGQDEVIVDLGPTGGLLVRLNDSSWMALHGLLPEGFVTGDLDGNGQDVVIVDFGIFGLWAFKNNSTWAPLHGTSPEVMATGDVDGNGRDDLVLAIATAGLWVRMNEDTWVQLHGFPPDDLVTADMDETGKDEIVMDFQPGFGNWVFRNNSTWEPLHGSPLEDLDAGNIDGL